jgi:methylenetetrahydrofolate reductase (NADPH)
MAQLSPASATPATSRGEIASQVAAFLDGFSLEAIRPNASDIDALKRAVPAGTNVYLSAVATRPPQEVAKHAAALRAAGFEPVPHLVTRNFTSREVFGDLLAQLRNEAAIHRVLIIAGDRDDAAGPLESALDAVESGLLQRHGIGEIGIAGYPDGHPRISSDMLDRALAAKIEAAEQSGLKVHIVTQFAFDADIIIAWIRRLRDLGIEQPVKIGMAGPTSLTTLLRYAGRCGVRASAAGMSRQVGLMKNLFGIAAPDAIVRAVAQASALGELGEVAAHFYSFDGLGGSARWVAEARAGNISLDNAGGFSVQAP